MAIPVLFTYVEQKMAWIYILYTSVFALDPHSMGSRIRIANADPDPEGGKSAPKKKKN
jgi:hypothetical protein